MTTKKEITLIDLYKNVGLKGLIKILIISVLILGVIFLISKITFYPMINILGLKYLVNTPFVAPLAAFIVALLDAIIISAIIVTISSIKKNLQ